MRRLQFGTRLIFLVTATFALFLSLVICARQAEVRFRRYRWAIAREYADPNQLSYRIGVLRDHFEGRPVIFLIEKVPYNVDPGILPSFCVTNEHIPSTDRIAFIRDVRVHGHTLIPTEQVQVLLADWGQAPTKHILTINQYKAIADRKAPLELADSLWNAIRTASRHQQTKQLNEPKFSTIA